MPLNDIRILVKEDMAQVDKLITAHLHPEITLINQLGHYIINNGGKRIRPLLVLLTAKAFNYPGTYHVTLAAIVEFIHTATLLHDDVVDASALRRGHETANAIWGNQASVLVGDYLFSRAFQMMVEVNSLRVMDILASAANTIAAGEVRQMLNCHDPDTTEATYYQVITDKTAKLFAAGTELGALISGQNEATCQDLANYGLHLGIAFQLTDDILDYTGDPQALGKNIGDDLAEGKPTLPLIYTIKNGTPEQQALIRHAIKEGCLDNLAEIQAAIVESGALEYTHTHAQKESEKALACLQGLPESPYKKALADLATFAIARCQ